MKTTKKDFQLYKKTISDVLNKLNIGGNYEIYFKHEKLDDGQEAEVTTDIKYHFATFSLALEYSGIWDDEYIKVVAKHEVGHFIIRKIITMATWRYVTFEEIDRANEEIAVMFSKIL